MKKSQIEIAVEFLKERGWEFRPAKKIEGVFKPLGKYDAKNPAQDEPYKGICNVEFEVDL